MLNGETARQVNKPETISEHSNKPEKVYKDKSKLSTIFEMHI